ncbi:uncharacterized protein [Drosophila bipectinata]|uniref:uncharacterized protein n=1 Tax=Drosophila bipectinata TaxID=42026 RepID=UPI0038B32B2A
MHVFVDASQSAFAAVVYWRITYEDGDVQVRFVCAKTKCAPMRTMTISRLELQAAVLGTRLMDTVRQDHSVPIAKIVLWTDSKTVLRWIGSTHRPYKQWLPSADNVADDATRAQRSVDLSEESRWLKRPEFLRRSAGSWPATAPAGEADAEDEEEMPSEFVLVGTSDTFISLKRFSSYRRLLRTTAWVLRFTRRCRGQRDELENYGLTVAESEAAEDLLVRVAQREAFPDEMQAVENGLDVAKGSDICGLAPYLDGNGRKEASDPLPPARSHGDDCARCPCENEASKRGCYDDGNPDQVLNYEVAESASQYDLGMQRVLRSDNGKRFVGADREAKRFAEIFEPQRIQSELSSKGIEWIFSCSANPSEGGVWERMVWCVKRVLRHTVKKMAPEEHVLESFLIEAENIVNSRPLTHLPVSADQEAPLTPNDLLKGEAFPPDTSGLDGGLIKEGATRKQWRVARMLRNRFWKRWVLEYLPTLTRREKWCRREKPIQRGDIVFVCDPAVPRRDCRKGVVEEAFAGTDGEVRRARVGIMDGDRTRWIMRPASKLKALDLSEGVLH